MKKLLINLNWPQITYKFNFLTIFLEENLDQRTKQDKQYLENIRQETLPESSFEDIVGQEEAKVALIQVF